MKIDRRTALLPLGSPDLPVRKATTAPPAAQSRFGALKAGRSGALETGRSTGALEAGRSRLASRPGFTLLELIVAFTILALFILPVLELVHRARLRATRTSIRREVQDLAQRRLFERIYTYSQETIDAVRQQASLQAMEGNFAEEGRPGWQWEIPYPQTVSQGEQVLLEYTIRVFAPELDAQKAGGGQSGGAGGGSGGGMFDSMLSAFGFGGSASDLGAAAGGMLGSNRPSSYEMTTWIFPSESWYLEQEALLKEGYNTGFYGNLNAR